MDRAAPHRPRGGTPTRGMIRTLRMLGVAAGLMLAGAHASDYQVGIVTHFDQDWNVVDFLPLLADFFVVCIREGVSWGDAEP